MRSTTGYSASGWPVASDGKRAWVPHCYGYVGVGRGLKPSTGSGAELYAVIGHAPRHLDRNIVVAGRVLSGIEALSSLPRGTGALGFYEDAEAAGGDPSRSRWAAICPRPSSRAGSIWRRRRRPLRGISMRGRTASRRSSSGRLGGADICNVPVPVRKVPG